MCSCFKAFASCPRCWANLPRIFALSSRMLSSSFLFKRHSCCVSSNGRDNAASDHLAQSEKVRRSLSARPVIGRDDACRGNEKKMSEGDENEIIGASWRRWGNRDVTRTEGRRDPEDGNSRLRELGVNWDSRTGRPFIFSASRIVRSTSSKRVGRAGKPSINE